MKTKLVASLFALSMLAQGCVIVSDDADSTITVFNDSDYAIYQLYIAERNTFDWGPNRLGSEPLFPGDAITLSVDCGTYDIEVWDELGTDCVLAGIDVCFSDDGWTITNDTLAVCDQFGVAASSGKAKADEAAKSETSESTASN